MWVDKERKVKALGLRKGNEDPEREIEIEIEWRQVNLTKQIQEDRAENKRHKTCKGPCHL